MFAHQVIEDLYEWLRPIKKKCGSQNWYVRKLEDIIAGIRQSQKFYIDGGIAFRQLRDHTFRNRCEPFFGDEQEGKVRLPYPLCWFVIEMVHPVTLEILRTSMLIEEIHNSAVVHFLVWASFTGDRRRWELEPFFTAISFGKPLCELNDFGELITRGSCSSEAETHCLKFSWADYPKILRRSPQLEVAFCEAMLSDLATILLLLNCKNVATENHPPDPALNKKRRRSGKQELFTYHTLVLKPVGKRQESIPKHLWENRIHLQRGHFKTYTPERPLFGSITGRFWWQAHVRGQNKEGIVMKDYQISAEAS